MAIVSFQAMPVTAFDAPSSHQDKVKLHQQRLEMARLNRDRADQERLLKLGQKLLDKNQRSARELTRQQYKR